MTKQFDAKAVSRLQKHYMSPQAVAQRERLLEVVGARPGESGIDIGCGAGHFTCEAARAVSPGGRIVGVDNSAASLDAARARVAEQGLQSVVELVPGEATALPFGDGSFDFAIVAQVYSYVPAVDVAIAEAARVLRRGGRLVVLDSDWDMCTFGSDDPALTRRMIAARASLFAHQHLPRELPRLLRDAGLRLVDAQAFSMLETSHDPDSFGFGLLPTIRQGALKSGIDVATIDRWEAAMRARTGEGEWYFALDRFIFKAVKDA